MKFADKWVELVSIMQSNSDSEKQKSYVLTCVLILSLNLEI